MQGSKHYGYYQAPQPNILKQPSLLNLFIAFIIKHERLWLFCQILFLLNLFKWLTKLVIEITQKWIPYRTESLGWRWWILIFIALCDIDFVFQAIDTPLLDYFRIYNLISIQCLFFSVLRAQTYFFEVRQTQGSLRLRLHHKLDLAGLKRNLTLNGNGVAHLVSKSITLNIIIIYAVLRVWIKEINLNINVFILINFRHVLLLDAVILTLT